MVTKGYQKGVYERVTKGTGGGVTRTGPASLCNDTEMRPGSPSNMNGLFGNGERQCIFSQIGGTPGNKDNHDLDSNRRTD